MKCPICEESFDSEKLFLEHIEFHKNNSILNSTQENYSPQVWSKTTQLKPQIDLVKIFGKEKFENLIAKQLFTVENIDELVQRRIFVEQVKQIIAKYPFVYIPYFIHDFIHGANSGELLKKYHILNHVELKNIIENILKFIGQRHRLSQEPSAFGLNLKISTWREKYELIKNNCNFFQNELLKLLFDNVLRSYLILITSDYFESGIKKEEIILKSKSIESDYDIFHFMDDSLKKYFGIFLDTNYENIVSEILTDLVDEGILKRKRSNPEMLIGPFSIDSIKQNILNELKFDSGSMNENTLRGKLTQHYPSLKLIPGLGLWETALKELESEKLIHIETKTNFRNDGLIFLSADYQKIQQKLQHFDNTQLEFYGRKISSGNFITELIELDKGDFNDKDDQVTRIAGLVLAESVKLQSPHEGIPEFDFSINIVNYHFRPEQLEAMAKLNFKINSEIFHCKVMINEVLTLTEYYKLKNALPNYQQGIVITFKTIPEEVKKQIMQNSAIQVIDEDGIKIWVSITSVIPSRRHSIAKLYFDPVSKLEKKIVKIDYINYENGLASITILPQMQESTALIRSLEEIPLYNPDPKEFEISSANYLEFLKLLSNLTKESDFINGLFNQKILSTSMIRYSKLILNFEHHEAYVNPKETSKKDILNCNCLQWTENKLYLCSHLVSALDYYYRTFGHDLKNMLENVINENVSLILDRLGIEHDYKTDQMYGDKRIADFIRVLSKTKESS